MPLSYSTYTGDASTTNFAITFDYLPETVVVSATPAGILVYLDDVKQTSGYSLVGTDIVFGAAPGSGVDIRIVRSTPRGKGDRLVDYEDSTTLTSALLDTSALQLLFIAQEAFEQSVKYDRSCVATGFSFGLFQLAGDYRREKTLFIKKIKKVSFFFCSEIT